MKGIESREEILEEAMRYSGESEEKMEPLERMEPSKPFVYVSLGGGELGDLVLSAARRILGGMPAGIKTVAMDGYQWFPAQDSADEYEVVDMMDGGLLEAAIARHVGDPSSNRHALFLEVERVDTWRIFEMGIKRGYNVVSTPYAPLIGMDRLATKLLFRRLDVPATEWRYAADGEGVEEAAEELGLPVIVKPVMTSSGHGTTIARSWKEVKRAYGHSVKNARGRGDEVVVEKFLPELKERGVEVTQLVLRHFGEDGRIVSTVLPPVEHWRPGATYHESWLPPTISKSTARECAEQARRVADAVGGLGIYSVEQFVVDGKVYTSEFANRPHDTGMITRWALARDEGALHLEATLGLPVTEGEVGITISSGYCVAKVALAPSGLGGMKPVLGWSPSDVLSFIRSRCYRGDFWFFGKPSAYPGRRMGIAVGCHEELDEARRIAGEIASVMEASMSYGT